MRTRTMLERTIEFAEMTKRAAQAGILKKLVISKLSDKDVKKTSLVPKVHNGRTLLVIERHMQDGKITQKNYAEFPESEIVEMLCDAKQANLIYSGGECEYKRSKSDTVTILGLGKFESSLSAPSTVKPTELVREKQYILKGDEPFLFALDITDKNGRIKDKRQAKFRQICRFLEYVRDMLEYVDKPSVVIYDLCCGKSYLSFAVYHYFKNVLGKDVRMLCVDLKKDVMALCSETAEKLGFDGMHFEAADITKLPSDTPPDIVLSLHACDTATDLVLENAVRLGAKVILSTPCCHRSLSRSINCSALEFATRHSILKSKLCDALTDSLRTCYLEKEGYRADACELVDPEDTPKNVIIRAVKRDGFDKNSKQAKKKEAEYNEILQFLGITK